MHLTRLSADHPWFAHCDTSLFALVANSHQLPRPMRVHAIAKVRSRPRSLVRLALMIAALRAAFGGRAPLALLAPAFAPHRRPSDPSRVYPTVWLPSGGNHLATGRHLWGETPQSRTDESPESGRRRPRRRATWCERSQSSARHVQLFGQASNLEGPAWHSSALPLACPPSELSWLAQSAFSRTSRRNLPRSDLSDFTRQGSRLANGRVTADDSPCSFVLGCTYPSAVMTHRCHSHSQPAGAAPPLLLMRWTAPAPGIEVP